MQTQKIRVLTSQNSDIHAKSLELTKRIGSTNYLVDIHFSPTSKEAVEDKLLRLMEREVKDVA